jgi:pimeloyl-ACP methyl ester carboxylesterase
VPFVDIAASPLAPGVSPVRIHYRTSGEGPPIVFLHGGWGYEIYPCDRQCVSLAGRNRIVIPDRSGYGKSQPISDLPVDFHRRAADETLALFDALGLEQPVVWGHSDGAIIALLIGLQAPRRICGAIVEAAHYFKRKPSSQSFFETMATNPRSLGALIVEVLARDHGDRWAEIVQRHSRAWLRIGETATPRRPDFYGEGLGALRVPVLIVHGARDPRTEPGELEALREALRDAESGFEMLEEAGHSPHSETAGALPVTRAVQAFASAVMQARASESP